ncbi:MAG: hypothetical protein CVU39_10170 [Chloroflexi bacterium HGW-Chloroflexi-10]|nr:MAG: hypothetical protein CVU39_10170 [Chloroflexi bacterium HGW-Chloroflexi-10]
MKMKPKLLMLVLGFLVLSFSSCDSTRIMPTQTIAEPIHPVVSTDEIKQTHTLTPTYHPVVSTIDIKETPSPTITYSPAIILTIDSIKKGKEKVYVVVDAVEKYYDDFGHYPGTINDLIPDYLPELPYTSEGYEIIYELSDYYIYAVGYYPERRYCAFTKHKELWECGFYSEH